MMATTSLEQVSFDKQMDESSKLLESRERMLRSIREKDRAKIVSEWADAKDRSNDHSKVTLKSGRKVSRCLLEPLAKPILSKRVPTPPIEEQNPASEKCQFIDVLAQVAVVAALTPAANKVFPIIRKEEVSVTHAFEGHTCVIPQMSVEYASETIAVCDRQPAIVNEVVIYDPQLSNWRVEHHTDVKHSKLSVSGNFRVEENANFPISREQAEPFFQKLESLLTCDENFSFRAAFSNVSYACDSTEVEVIPGECKQPDAKHIWQRHCICQTDIYKNFNRYRRFGRVMRQAYNYHIHLAQWQFDPVNSKHAKVQASAPLMVSHKKPELTLSSRAGWRHNHRSEDMSIETLSSFDLISLLSSNEHRKRIPRH